MKLHTNPDETVDGIELPEEDDSETNKVPEIKEVDKHELEWSFYQVHKSFTIKVSEFEIIAEYFFCNYRQFIFLFILFQIFLWSAWDNLELNESNVLNLPAIKCLSVERSNQCWNILIKY